ncbi:hypothetical protein [Aeoliella mucimassa]|uniref:DUF4870 domain-containing protein n=1 Tax=Aeoliella mucimassa TaxID=2527972 RepID=A0A518AKX9_9BACT|nr:hypothetical protein [Aeoliella mucimassa]QDU55380.1 hypothetical protein Pan181_15690 [Aeoliella mucimassa]
MSNNPFQAPLEAPAAPSLADAIRVVDNALVVPSGVRLPPRCVATNAPTQADDAVRKKIAWVPSMIYLLLLLGPFPFLIGYFVTRKECLIEYSESREVRSRRRNMVLVNALASLAFFLGICGMTVLEMPFGVWTMVMLFLLSLIAFAFTTNGTIKIAHHDNGMFWIKGFHPDYLYDLTTGA